jgi:hypothetical protein
MDANGVGRVSGGVCNGGDDLYVMATLPLTRGQLVNLSFDPPDPRQVTIANVGDLHPSKSWGPALTSIAVLPPILPRCANMMRTAAPRGFLPNLT